MDIQIREDMICTFLGPFGTENVCSGDSGSPLMVFHKGKKSSLKKIEPIHSTKYYVAVFETASSGSNISPITYLPLFSIG